MAEKDMKQGVEEGVGSQRIRITLTCQQVKPLEKGAPIRLPGPEASHCTCFAQVLSVSGHSLSMRAADIWQLQEHDPQQQLSPCRQPPMAQRFSSAMQGSISSALSGILLTHSPPCTARLRERKALTGGSSMQ